MAKTIITHQKFDRACRPMVKSLAMDIAAIGKLAIELGVIPAVALFLILAMQVQNKRLTQMLQEREQQSLEIVKLLIAQIAENRQVAKKTSRNAHAE